MPVAIRRTRAVAALAALLTVVPITTATAAHHRHTSKHHHAHHHATRNHHPYRHHRNRLINRVHTDWWLDRRVHSVVHVLRVDPGARIRFRVVPASSRLADNRLVRTSRMCRRVHCLAAVNGSFRDIPSRLPRGGEIVDRTPVRLRIHEPLQAIFGSRRPVRAGHLRSRLTLVVRGGPSLHLGGVNVAPRHNSISVYTWHYGRRTPRNHHATFTVRARLGGHAHFRLGRSFAVQLGRPTRKRLGIHAHSVVLVGRGKAGVRLARLTWLARQGAKVRLVARSHANPPQSLSTSYRLLRNGHVVAPREHRPFVTGRNPRTVLGWTRHGKVWLITIDGRSRRSRGASLVQAARVAHRLGATQAVNLDGGGSTSFVVRGHVRNHPSDGRERSVVNSLAIVRTRHLHYYPNARR
jgi:phosphodiester glycosidase